MKLLRAQIIDSPVIERSEKAVESDAGEITYCVIDGGTFVLKLALSDPSQ
jgi:hypothetical protein